MNRANSTKMEHLSDRSDACPYRLQARQALVSHSFLSFFLGVATSVMIGSWIIEASSSTVIPKSNGKLGCNIELQSCQNTWSES